MDVFILCIFHEGVLIFSKIEQVLIKFSEVVHSEDVGQ